MVQVRANFVKNYTYLSEENYSKMSKFENEEGEKINRFWAMTQFKAK